MANKKTKHGNYGLYLTRLKRFYQRKEVKLYTNLILSFLAIAGFAIFAIRPTVVTISQLLKELQDQKQVNQRLSSKLDHLRQAKKAYKNIENDLYLAQEALPQEPEPDLFVAQLEKLAQENGCLIETISLGSINLKGEIATSQKKGKTKTPEDSQPTLGGTLHVNGRYQDLVSFLSDLFNFRRLNTVNNVSFEKASGDQLELTLNFITYYLPKEK